MMCAVEVPAFMIHAPLWDGLSGSPRDCAVAPGTAMVVWWKACSWSGPIKWMNADPNSGFTLVPSFSAAYSAA